MATLLDLVAAGTLHRVDPELEPGEREHRFIYATDNFRDRMLNHLPTYVSQWSIEEDPLQQFANLLEVFCSGEALTFERRFKPLTHHGDGIWELKTPDLRLFGWFNEVDSFVANSMDTAEKTKRLNLYRPYALEAVGARARLPPDGQKYVIGELPSDVVKAFSFP